MRLSEASGSFVQLCALSDALSRRLRPPESVLSCATLPKAAGSCTLSAARQLCRRREEEHCSKQPPGSLSCSPGAFGAWHAAQSSPL
eukprot:2461992-Alexandrium_andersonii.AAC.3